jgi:hypothetical protein
VPSVVASVLSTKVTVPVGMGPDPETVAVMVTTSPNVDGLGADTTTVVEVKASAGDCSPMIVAIESSSTSPRNRRDNLITAQRKASYALSRGSDDALFRDREKSTR